jgi:hypothetical protein
MTAGGAAPAAAAAPGLLGRLRGKDEGAAAGAVLIGLVAVTLFCVAQPRLGITDVDGYAYAMGGRDIRAGLGYRGLAGDSFAHWPPGYSLILSLGSDPLVVAWAVNGISFGVTLALVFLLARRVGWTWQAAAGLSVGLGAGFFHAMAATVHADILTYALFLAALIPATARPGRTLPGAVWAVLTPLKFIAVAFLPAAFLADLASAPKTFWRLVLRYLPAGLITAALTGAVLVYNQLTIGTWMAASHASPSLHDLALGARSFVVSIPREFLFSWYGALTGLWPKLTLGVTLALLGVCAVSMKPAASGRWLRLYGAGFLVCCAILLCVRSFDPSVRLSGYGLVALVLGFRPLRWANWAWLAFALVSLATAVAGDLVHNNLGSNDPRYVRLAGEVAASHPGPGVIASNAFYILDLHAGVASAPISDYADAAPYQLLLRVTLPSYDSLATTVAPLAPPPALWCLEKTFAGAELYRRCAAP